MKGTVKKYMKCLYMIFPETDESEGQYIRYLSDYLNEHPDAANEYEALKLRLWKQYEHNRNAYTDAKTDFISEWTAEARKKYGDRY